MPAYNEEAGLEEALQRVVRALDDFADAFEVIVINDGSHDRTGLLAEALARRDPRIRVIHNERNLNYGISLWKGIRAAAHEWILHDGVDLPLAPEDLDKFTRYFGDYDVIVARRESREAHSPWRKLTSLGNNLLLRILFAPRSADLNFVQFYRRAYVQALEPQTTSPAFVTPELILRAEKTHRRIREVHARFHRRTSGEAHFGRLHDILWTFRDMLRFRGHTWIHGWDP
jgi:glycosyltransferase involved in cell wall biosynthesis